VLIVGFQLTPDNVHLEIRNDMHGNHMGTGVAYVQFVSSEAAEQARNIKHKQMMGTRYIECMILIPGQTLLKTYTLHLQAICTRQQCSVHIIALFVPPVTG